jgi:hypothetical protein
LHHVSACGPLTPSKAIKTVFLKGLPMRLKFAALLLVVTPSLSVAAPATKEQLMKPATAARHFTISSAAGKHGDVWSWTMPDKKIAYRMSMSLRGWITETDQVTTLGRDGRPTGIAIRGFTDSGDATEDFSVDEKGVARWKTAIDTGSAPFLNRRYNSYGGPWLAGERDIEALVKAGPKGIDLLPGGRADYGAIGSRNRETGLCDRIRLRAITDLAGQGQPLFWVGRRHLAASRRL